MKPFPLDMIEAGNWYADRYHYAWYVCAVVHEWIEVRQPSWKGRGFFKIWDFELVEYVGTPCERWPLAPEGLKESLGFEGSNCDLQTETQRKEVQPACID